MSFFELPRPSRDLRFTGEMRAAGLGKARPPPPSVRARMDSIDDAAETKALAREILDLPRAPLGPKPPKHADLGVPNFRRTAAPPEPQLVWIPPAAKRKSSVPRAPGLTLLVWAFLAIVGGSVSYRYAPGVADAVMSAVHTFER
jgi:hypothetical protein